MRIRAATDVGGTYTDLVYYTIDSDTGRCGKVCTAKVDTTPPNFEKGVMASLRKGGVSTCELEFFAHGATVVINAITERKGARVGLITTRGFRDVIEIARGNRPDLFNFNFEKPRPFVERHLRLELPERCNYKGEIELPADLTALPAVLERFRSEGVEAIAICFLHAYRNPTNEAAVAAAIRASWPEVSVVASHELSREWREYERASTTVLSAYVHPVTQRYINSLEQELTRSGFERPPYMMLSNGGIATVATAKANPVAMVESGPASGIFAGAHLGKLIDEPNLIMLDIGGTTAKCALVEGGNIKISTDYHVERTRQSPGYPIQTAVSEIVEIGNGGGSIAWVDAGGKLHVGPQSAGAVPGPAAYGRGGQQATTTDANLLLGRIDPASFAGGEVTPDWDAVNRAFETLGKKLGVSPVDAARGVVRIANANMANALRLVSTNKGYDPRDFALMAFGGGGPMHAVALARDLKVPRVIVPVNSAVFSAWGMLLTDLRRDDVHTFLMALNAATAGAVAAQFRAMEADAAANMKREGFQADGSTLVFEHLLDMRYQGQEHTVKIPVSLADASLDVGTVADLFHATHEKRYTYRLPNPIQIVNFHLVARALVPKPSLPRARVTGRRIEAAVIGSRRVDFDVDGTHAAVTYNGALLEPGMKLQGPAVIQEPAVTLVVPPGEQVSIDDYGNYHVELGETGMSRDPFTLEIVKDALVAIGLEMFDAMIRTSMSPIVYETTDFAVGVTDARGNLIAQGNGVTAFLATLDTAVQSALQHYPEAGDLQPGDILIANIPYEGGGTHLSDVIILVPVFHGQRLIAWTVNKAHWTEVGGAQAGSVSTVSTEIYQEGLQFPFVKLYEGGRINKALVAMIRANVRLPESTIGDMYAGVAAANVGARRLSDMVAKYGVGTVLDAMVSLLDYGERMTLEELAKLPAGVYEADDVVESDGLGHGPFRIKVQVTVSARDLVVDFTGTDKQAVGPINCTLTGLVTGVRCVFKSITNPELPANGGCFRPLRIVCPPGTFISAQSPAPVSLYYESLLAAMDVMWKALAAAIPDRLPAGHQRSVNATFIAGLHPDTRELFIMGEPLVGGWGATPRRDGDNGQFCCANRETYNIPVELFESRYGLKVEQYAFHNEDGGAGQYRGGKGVVLDYRVTAEEAYLTYATTRSANPPWSLSGGRPGSLNSVSVYRHDGSVEHYDMCTRVRVVKGELIRLTTATGGGYGDPGARARSAIVRDLQNEFITPQQAAADYGFEPAQPLA